MRALVTLFLLACGSPARPQHVAPETPQTVVDAGAPAPASDVDPSVPEDLRASIERSQKIGGALFVLDRQAAIASDALIATKSPGLDRILGYLTLPVDHGVETSFFVGDPPAVAFRVTLDVGQRAPNVQRVDPPEAPNARVAACFRARQAALAAARRDGPEQRRETVVVPATILGETGLLVYLLATTDNPDTVVLGKHYRVHTTDDGAFVSLEPLSKGALELSKNDVPKTGTATGLYATHLVTEYPLETHVLASLQVRLPIFVMTSRGIWKVDGDKITFLGKHPTE